MTLAQRTARFWSAAYYLRRWPDADPTKAIALITGIADSTTGPLKERIDQLLKERPNDQQSGTRYDL